MGQVRVHVVFSRVGQSIYELVNDTGWDKELGDFFMDCPVPAPFMTVRLYSTLWGHRHPEKIENARERAY